MKPPLPIRLFAVAVFLAVFPFFLRRRPRVERRITICAPPRVIFPMINDLRNWPLWTEWSRRDDIHFSYGETPAGEDAMQRWSTRKMSGVMRITRSEPDTRIDYELEISPGFQRLLGRIELTEDGACTRVAWRCVWDLAHNPYRRYLDLLCRWWIARDFAAGLRNLKDLVENPSAP